MSKTTYKLWVDGEFTGEFKTHAAVIDARNNSKPRYMTRIEPICHGPQRCPKCKQLYCGYPAISRVDNETEICPACGTREAMEAFMREKGIEADA